MLLLNGNSDILLCQNIFMTFHKLCPEKTEEPELNEDQPFPTIAVTPLNG